MVKNTTGGTKTKGMARKHMNSAGGDSAGGALRVPTNSFEQIVIVTKMLGNGMCEVYNNDDVRLIAHIRNKFKGRHRRSNDISVNSFILIGLREWENPFKNCDVLFVYEHSHLNTLSNNPTFHIQRIIARDSSNHHIIDSIHDFDFDNDNDNQKQKQKQKQKQNDLHLLNTTTTFDSNDIYFNDI